MNQSIASSTPNPTLERQFARLAALARFELLQHPLNLQSVLRHIVEIAERLLPTTGGASIVLWNAAEERFHISASTNPMQESGMTAQRVRRTSGASRWIVEQNRPVVVGDVADDPFGANPMLTEYGIQAYVGFPIRSEGQVVGVLYALDRHVRSEYTPDELDFLNILASRAGSAIAHANLFAQIELLAARDPLTGLWNRRAFLGRADEEMLRAQRLDHPLSLLVIDIDNFKLINDLLGHPVGDRVLQNLTERMREIVRQVDLLARYGGEEFVILLPETDLPGAAGVAERLRASAASRPLDTAGEQVQMTVSVGVAVKSASTSTLTLLLDQADKALYRAKRSGKNRVEIYGEECAAPA